MLKACLSELAARLRPIYQAAEIERGEPLRERIVVDQNQDRKYLNWVKEKFREIKSGKYGSSFARYVNFRDSATDEALLFCFSRKWRNATPELY
jgi:hypothetical protein